MVDKNTVTFFKGVWQLENNCKPAFLWPCGRKTRKRFEYGMSNDVYIWKWAWLLKQFPLGINKVF